MATKFSAFPDGEIMRDGDQVVGLRSGANTRFDFPGDGIKDANQNYLVKWTSGGAASPNCLQLYNSLTGDPVIVEASGNDASVGLLIRTKLDGDIDISLPGEGDINVDFVGDGNFNITNNGSGLFILNASTGINSILDQDDMLSNSALAVPTQQSTKAYVDSNIATLAAITYITKLDATGTLPNSQPLSTLATGILASTTTTGVVASRVLTGTLNQVDIANGNGSANPTWTISSTLSLPGSLSFVALGSATVDTILDEDNMISDDPNALATQQSIKAYVDAITTNISDSTFITNTNETATLPNSDPLSAKASGILASVTTTGALNTRVLTGTTNQVDIANGDGVLGNPTWSLSATLVFPGTAKLSGNLDVTGFDIVSLTAGDIDIIPDTTGLVHLHGVTISSANAVSAITQLDVDNIRIDTNTISSTDVNGNIVLDPNGSGAIDLSSDTVLVGADIQHSGDTNNKITFGTDTQTFDTGASSRLDISDSGVRMGGANARVTTILDEDDMVSNSATALATQQSIKAYVDSRMHIENITIANPTAIEDQGLFFTKAAITVTQFSAVVMGITPSVTYTIRFATDRSAAGTEVVTGGSTVTSTTTGDIVTSFNDATIPANSWVWLETTAVDVTTTQVTLTINYTID